MIVVTGAAGFVGSHLCEALLARKTAVFKVDPRIGVNTWEQVARCPDAVDGVFHLGAITNTTSTDWPALMENNLGLSMQIARWCRDHGKPLVYASSASVYGNDGIPLNLYAESKWLFDEWAERMLGGSWWGARLFNVYGAGEEAKGNQASLVHKMIEAMINGDRPELFCLDARRDFIHVRDAVAVMLWMMDHRPLPGIYDVGCGEAISIEDLFDEVERHLGVSSGYTEIGMPKRLQGRYQFNTEADLFGLQDQGYVAPIDKPREGIADMLQAMAKREQVT